MKMKIGGRRCVIQSYELDDNIFEIEDRAELIYINMGVEFEEGVIYHDFKYFFETQELRINRYIEEERVMSAFIKEHLITILGRVLLWDSEDNRASKFHLGDRVMVKGSLTLATVTGKIDTQNPHYELDNDFEKVYRPNELILWGAMPKEERESLNYKGLTPFNLALDKVEFKQGTAYEVNHEYHNGDERVQRFMVVGDSYSEVYEEALGYFNASVEEGGV